MELQKIIEGLEAVEEQGMSAEDYRKEVEDIIENEFEPIRQKLLDGARKAVEQGLSIETVDNGSFGRMLDKLALTTARVYDILNGGDVIEREGDRKYAKSKLRKVRKALGYNL